MIARWPGKVAPGSVSDLPSAFWDFLPTACDLAGAVPPDDIDGISYLPTLLGKDDQQRRHEYLYWASQEGATSVGFRVGDWKLVRYKKDTKSGPDWRLYNLDQDISESNDVSSDHPKVVQDLLSLMHREGLPLQPPK